MDHGTTFQLRFTDDITEIGRRSLTPMPPGTGTIRIVPGKGAVDLAGLPSYQNDACFAILSTEFHSRKNCDVQLAAAADWWFDCYVNGELVYSTMDLGNGGAPDAKRHHFPAHLKEGENRIVFVVERGADSMKFYFDLQPLPANADAVKCRIPVQLERELRPPQPEFPLLFPPLITHMTPRTMLIRAITTVPVKLGAEACFPNGERFTVFGDGGCRTVHTLKLDHPAKRIEGTFRLFTCNGGKRTDLAEDYPVHSFGKTGPLRFLAFGDTQHSMLYRFDLLKKYAELAERANVDFVVHLGDIDSFSDNYESRYLRGFLEPYARLFHGRPLMPVFGNHELRGKEPRRWFDQFAIAPGETCYTFRGSEIFFAVLDGGDEDPKIEQLIPHQQQILKAAFSTPEFQNAKYRIVLIHGVNVEPFPTGSKMKAVLEPFHNGADFDLVIAGHVHRYALYPRGQYPFPIVTLDGPGGVRESSALLIQFDGDSLSACALTPDGEEFDRFTIMNRKQKPIATNY